MRQPAGIYQVDVLSSLAAQMETLTRKIDRLQSPTNSSQVFSCEWGGEGHPTGKCNTCDPNHYTHEDANMTNSGFRDHPYGNSHNPNWRQHSDSSWQNNLNPTSRGESMQNNPWSNHQIPPSLPHQPHSLPQEKQESMLEKLIQNFLSHPPIRDLMSKTQDLRL